MPKPDRIVINTSPLITLVAALGDLTVLRSLYTEVLVPLEVCQEITAGGRDGFAVAEFEAANWLLKQDNYLNISPFLLNSLDLGEAAVIQLALESDIQTVCIDEAVGRRIARLNNLYSYRIDWNFVTSKGFRISFADEASNSTDAKTWYPIKF